MLDLRWEPFCRAIKAGDLIVSQVAGRSRIMECDLRAFLIDEIRAAKWNLYKHRVSVHEKERKAQRVAAGKKIKATKLAKKNPTSGETNGVELGAGLVRVSGNDYIASAGVSSATRQDATCEQNPSSMSA